MEIHMKNSSDIKESIITAATGLIQQSSGNISEITTRAIAGKANVGIGLINYHFQSKDNLITICVQRIIQQVILSFSMEGKTYTDDKERLTDWAVHVFDFLFENPAISRISILGDLSDYRSDCNSVKTQKGFMFALDDKVPEADKQMLSFILTAAMQTAFLSRQITKELLGYDLDHASHRKVFITKLVKVLFNEAKKEEGDLI
ncbi:TetR/AcrR family transcriptional regulator [Kineothrix alysoides]|nr:TetR/AcrR family transcriptional regulator [Kineothrix alysoides]